MFITVIHFCGSCLYRDVIISTDFVCALSCSVLLHPEKRCEAAYRKLKFEYTDNIILLEQEQRKKNLFFYQQIDISSTKPPGGPVENQYLLPSMHDIIGNEI